MRFLPSVGGDNRINPNVTDAVERYAANSDPLSGGQTHVLHWRW